MALASIGECRTQTAHTPDDPGGDYAAAFALHSLPPYLQGLAFNLCGGLTAQAQLCQQTQVASRQQVSSALQRPSNNRITGKWATTNVGIKLVHNCERSS